MGKPVDMEWQEPFVLVYKSLTNRLGYLSSSSNIWNLEKSSCNVVISSNITEDNNLISLPIKKASKENSDLIVIVKDNSGLAFIPEWSFSGIGDFNPGYGYQIKVIESIQDFRLCSWYLNQIQGY